MPGRRTVRRVVLVLVAAAAGAGTWALAVHAPPGERSFRSFDTDRMTDLETEMWQAYYRKEKLRLFRLLVTMLHEQYHYPWAKAARAGFHLARAAARFGDAKGDYERVLPDLVASYAIARDWMGAHYDPAAVARAELAWWVARRDPARNGVDSVGGLIADEYALLYEMPRERLLQAALLRAKAAKLRDEGGANADWGEVHEELADSYEMLHATLNYPGR